MAHTLLDQIQRVIDEIAAEMLEEMTPGPSPIAESGRGAGGEEHTMTNDEAEALRIIAGILVDQDPTTLITVRQTAEGGLAIIIHTGQKYTFGPDRVKIVRAQLHAETGEPVVPPPVSPLLQVSHSPAPAPPKPKAKRKPRRDT